MVGVGWGVAVGVIWTVVLVGFIGWDWVFVSGAGEGLVYEKRDLDESVLSLRVSDFAVSLGEVVVVD